MNHLHASGAQIQTLCSINFMMLLPGVDSSLPFDRVDEVNCLVCLRTAIIDSPDEAEPETMPLRYGSQRTDLLLRAHEQVVRAQYVSNDQATRLLDRAREQRLLAEAMLAEAREMRTS